MRRDNFPLAYLLIVAVSACSAVRAQDAQVDGEADDAITAVQEAVRTPTQLAQYPGAPYEDRNGVLWFSSVLKGLIRFDGKEFVTFTTKDGLPANGVRPILEADDGRLWIGTTGGVAIYDGQTFTALTDYGDIAVNNTSGMGGYHLDIWDVIQDRNGDFWIATLDGVFRYNGKAFEPFPLPVIAGPKRFEFAPKMVYHIYEDKDGVLWFGTDGSGVVRYDGKDMTVFTAEANGLCSDRVCEVIQDGRGDFWFGTSDGGVSRYDGTSFTTHLRSATFSKHTGWGRFMSIYEDRAGDVWFGVSSTGGGVHRWNGESFRYYSEADGLGNGGVPSIREDRRGNLWFGTTTGVFRFEDGRFVNFTEANPDTGRAGGESAGENANASDAALIKDWASETFPLPPGFAPELPKGSESLRFSPGWRDPSAEGFWSYCFVMWIDEAAPDAKRVGELIDGYYDGLMATFAGNAGKDIGTDPAQVEVTRIAPNRFEAKLHVIDAFATFKPKDIRILVETAVEPKGHSSVRIQLSPQPKEHTIWRSLAVALAGIKAP